MLAETIRGLLKATPFRTFRIHMSDGEVFAIRHPELAFLPPKSTVMHVWNPDARRVAFLHIRLITSVDPNPMDDSDADDHDADERRAG